MESFEAALHKLILLLDTHLKRHILHLNDASKFVKMTSINIFLFHHVKETIGDVETRVAIPDQKHNYFLEVRCFVCTHISSIELKCVVSQLVRCRR